MATNKTNRNNGKNRNEMVAAGAGIAALAAGIYFFFGPDGKKHQKKMKGWMVSMKGEVLEKLEETQEVTEPVYNNIVDSIASAYSIAGKIPKNEIMELASDMKRQWRTIKKTVGGNKSTSRKSSSKKSTARPSAKKSSAKTSKKATSSRKR